MLQNIGKQMVVQALACLADQVGNLRQPVSSDAITAHNLVYDLPGAQTFHAGLGAILGEVASNPSFHYLLLPRSITCFLNGGGDRRTPLVTPHHSTKGSGHGR